MHVHVCIGGVHAEPCRRVGVTRDDAELRGSCRPVRKEPPKEVGVLQGLGLGLGLGIGLGLGLG